MMIDFQKKNTVIHSFLKRERERERDFETF
jgi:hypothetical protein